MTEASDKVYPYSERGDVEKAILSFFRNRLRGLVNPDTGAVHSEREVATVTARGSRHQIQATVIDLVVGAGQQRGLHLANQGFAARSTTEILEKKHAESRKMTRLPAVGGSGTVKIKAPDGTAFPGSTTLPDGGAVQFTADDGLAYQVLYLTAASVNGYASGVNGVVLEVQAIDTGEATNISVSTKLNFSLNKPAPADDEVLVSDAFTGGGPEESDQDLARRINDDLAYRAASGNAAHFRAWSRESSASVEDAFVFPCAMHSGTVIVVPTQKRSGASGPLARIPSTGTLNAVKGAVVPPQSPNVPAKAMVLVIPPVSEPVDLTMSLALPYGATNGWTDNEPWPIHTAALRTAITALTDQVTFQVTIPATSSAPATATPSLMAWNATTSRFEALIVTSVTLNAGEVYDVVLTSAPSFTLAVGAVISPASELAKPIACAVESYMDSVGPGEVVASTDPRSGRAYRRPEPTQGFPYRVGSAATNYVQSALGATLAGSVLESASASAPTLPVDPSFGPSLLTLGLLGLTPL